VFFKKEEVKGPIFLILILLKNNAADIIPVLLAQVTFMNAKNLLLVYMLYS
jgi:hypothetical protein